jgi:hypothetical protein
MKTNKKFWISVSVGALVSGAILSYPKILRWQVEKRLPGVQFTDVNLSTSGVKLSGVTFNRGWISGDLESVTSDFHGEHVLLDGGNLTVNLDDKPEGDDKPDGFTVQKRDIQLRNLGVKVSHTDHNITMEGVRTDGHKVCFSSAKLEVPTITTGEGCFNREDHKVTVGRADMKELNIMGAGVQDLTAQNITFHTKAKVAEVEKVTAQITFEKQVFTVEAGGVRASRKPDKVELESLKVKHPWLAGDWLELGRVSVGHGDRWSLAVGGSHIGVEPKSLTISGEEECGTWIDSLPPNLKAGPLSKVKMTGKSSFSIGFRPKPTFNLRSDCRAKCDSLPNLRKPFRYMAYDPKGKTFERETGRGTKNWVSLLMTGDMPLAVTTMEDPGFEHHRGFIVQAFSNSFLDNLKQGRFLRGGSTITMQLAKNLWLTREKTLGRKVQEFFLSQALESCYSKDEIMELYLNVVEFGPNQYGVGNGSMYWFHKGPGELVPTEAFWLASILPRPSRTQPPTDSSLKHVEGLMKRLAEDGRIPNFTEDMVEPEEVQTPEEP